MAPTHVSPALEILAALIIAAAFTAFAVALFRRIRLLTVGRPENRREAPLQRFLGMAGRVFGQLLVVRRVAGIFHFFIFWGFVVLLLANLQFLGEAVWRDFKIPLVTGTAWYGFLFDVFVVLVIAAVLAAAGRRVFFRPPGPTNNFGAFFILFLIFGLMATDLICEGYRVATAREARITSITPAWCGYAVSWALSWPRWAPASAAAGRLITKAGLVGSAGWPLYAFSWWAHLIFLLTFLVYIPLSKHLHLLFCPVNEFFRDLGPRGRLKDCDVSDDNADHFGIIRCDEFTWRQLLDFYACVECGRCQDNCPAFNTGKPLSPKKVIQDLKHNFLAEAPRLLRAKPRPAAVKEEGKGLAGEVVTDDELWSCTTCGACVEHCPLAVEHINKIVDLRRDLTLNEGRVPHELNAAMNGVERNNNPYGLPSAERVKWAEGSDVPTFGAGATAEWCLWVSCLGAYDDRGRRQVAAFVKLLQAAGVSFATLGEEEGCCAEAFRRLGHEYLYKAKLEENAQAFQKYGIRKILTTCPHCFNTFKNEYGALGYEVEVRHHSEFLRDLIREGKLKINAQTAGRIAFHDSCYLGRYNGVYEAPRALVRAAGGTLVEFNKNRRSAFCCGAGGGRMWLEEKLGTRINHERAKQALATGADTVAVACAYCLTMLDDAVKDLGANVAVKDVAELLAAHLAA